MECIIKSSGMAFRRTLQTGIMTQRKTISVIIRSGELTYAVTHPGCIEPHAGVLPKEVQIVDVASPFITTLQAREPAEIGLRKYRRRTSDVIRGVLIVPELPVKVVRSYCVMRACPGRRQDRL